MDPERARRRLAEERDRIEKQLAGLEVQELADSPENSGDQAADLERAETDEGLRQELKSTLEAIARAEARLEDGTYGVSVISGEPIPDGRLEAIPWADRTVEEEPGGRGLTPARRDQQVVEELRRQPRLQDLVVEPLQRQVAAEGEPAPAARDLIGICARLQGPDGPPMDRSEELLAADPHVDHPGPLAEPLQIARRERVHVDLRLQGVPIRLGLGALRGGPPRPSSSATAVR